MCGASLGPTERRHADFDPSAVYGGTAHLELDIRAGAGAAFCVLSVLSERKTDILAEGAPAHIVTAATRGAPADLRSVRSKCEGRTHAHSRCARLRRWTRRRRDQRLPLGPRLRLRRQQPTRRRAGARSPRCSASARRQSRRCELGRSLEHTAHSPSTRRHAR
jgi:hypothetical protein